MGLVGPGFVGAHHVDAVRRLGFVDVVAICDVTREAAEAKAEALGVPKAYGSVEALAADPDIHVVHVTTPNAQHGHGDTRRAGGGQARPLREAAGDVVGRGLVAVAGRARPPASCTP